MTDPNNETDFEDDDFAGFEIEDDDAEAVDIEEVDDTPEEDRGRAPMPKELVEELEADDLGEYS